MKKILAVYTGGTICSAPENNMRDLHPALAKRALLTCFAESDSAYASKAKELFVDSELPAELQTLSENMTPDKLSGIIRHIKSFDLTKYSGIIVLHGTDTLAYTAALFAFVFARTPVPIMIVSGNRPPMDPESNANANFRTATELIMNGIAPNVYVPYRNSNGSIKLFLGSSVMQCANYSENFRSASEQKVFEVYENTEKLFSECQRISESINRSAYPQINELQELQSGVKLITAHTGLDYSDISLNNTKAIIHGTYHSGTVCIDKANTEAPPSQFSILHLSERCKKNNIPLFIAPCKLDKDQYASAFEATRSGAAIPLDMTTEAAYGKLIVGISCGLCGDTLIKFMLTEINDEMAE